MSYVNYTLGCKECGNQWKALCKKGDPLPRCPHCAGKPQQQLSAPAIGRGAAQPTGIAVPQSASAREQLAADLYLQGTGHTDIQRGLREGDTMVKPLQTPGLPANMQANYQGGAGDMGPVIKGLGASTPDQFKRRNLSLIGRKN